MLYRYKAINQETGEEKGGIIEAPTAELAIVGLQRRKFIIVSIIAVDDISFWDRIVVFEKRVAYRDIVMLSRQIATLFHAQVSALRLFQVLSLQVENPALKRTLDEVTEDIQAGTSLSSALGKHSEVFSDFYVNMVRAGEESGNLAATFEYLADYLDRSYALISKTRNALI
ncbi:MAG: Type II secretion system F domain protein, partial [Candidatus Giovannonibacteria bacterium GW2011_GWA2_53_7]